MFNSNHNKQKIKKYCRIHDKNIGLFIDNLFLDKQILKTTNKQNCDLFIPSGVNDMNITNFPKNTIISSIDGINELNKKNYLWRLFRNLF